MAGALKRETKITKLSKAKRILALFLASLLAATVLVACGGSDDSDSAADNGEAAVEAGSDQTDLTIGYIPWDEDIAVSYLWKQVLEDNGYNVDLTQLDVAPTFVGLSKGDIDVFFDTWLPITHEDYWKQYGDQLEDLGSWYDNASLTLAVPDYVDVDSLADLAENRDTFGGKIVGIESGAGLTRVTKDEVMPTYGLEDFNLQTSSTAAMIAALKKATDAKEPIVVTLWHPHWAYSAFPIKDLEDPEGALGGAEQIHTVARDGFSDDFPKLAEAIKSFEMSDELLADLENVVLQDHADNLEQGVKVWIADNQEFVDGMLD